MILVTGIAGFIGSHLGEKILKNGYELVGLDNFCPYYSPAIKRNNLKNIIKDKNAIVIENDIRFYNKLERIFKKYRPEVVFHLAAQAGVRYSMENPLYYEQTNCLGTLNLLELSKKYEVKKFIFASSSSVYGSTNKVPFSENEKMLRPTSFYGMTKLIGEKYCQFFNKSFKLPIVILRYFTVYGPRQRPDMAIHKFVQKISTNQEIELYGFGKLKRDFTYIDDITDGTIKLLDGSKVIEDCFENCEIFNLGNSKPVSVNKLVNLIEALLNKKAKKTMRPIPDGDVKQTYADIAKARKILNFRPKTSLEEGLKKFILWKQEIGADL